MILLPAECPDPPELLDGSFALSDGGESITGTSPRDATATYSCSLGFDLVGADTLACQLGNVWSPTAPGSCQGNCSCPCIMHNSMLSITHYSKCKMCFNFS